MLTVEQIKESVKEFIAVFLHDIPENYYETVLKYTYWMDGFQFREVCKSVGRSMTSGRRPAPKQYVDAHNDLDKRFGWSNKKTDGAACGDCDNSGFVPAFFRDRTGMCKDGKPLQYSGVRYCPACSSKKIDDKKTADFAGRFEPISREEFESLSPAKEEKRT